MTEHTHEPAATGEPDPTAQGDDVNAGSVQQDMAAGNQVAVRNPYDTVVPETLRERIAYARAMAQAGILPKDYQAKPANVLVAGEMGRELGLSTVQSVLMLNVVEGRPQLGASGVRAVVARAGHHMSPAHITYSKHGVPVEATITAWRQGEDDHPVTTTWHINRAVRAGLCSVERDAEGEAVSVKARSQYGKPLPWEAFTEDMLDARCTTKLGRTLFADVTMGLSYEKDELEVATAVPATTTTAVQEQPAAPAPTPRAAAKLDELRPARRTSLPEDYDVLADLEVTGAEWWTHAGAQVARRSTVQLAADRIARWVADNPEEAERIDVPMPDREGDPVPAEQPADEPDAPDDDVVEAELVEDPEPEVGDVPADDEPATPEPGGPEDPWRADTDDQVEDVPEDVPGHDKLPMEQVDLDDGPELGDDAPELNGQPDAEELLAMIDSAAEQLGKTRTALMVRWIATHRKNPEDATAEELGAFYDQLRPLLDAQG